MVVVVISGQPGCGSTTAGTALARKLGVEFFSLGKWNKEQLGIIEGKEHHTETENSIAMWKNAEGKSKGFHVKSDEMALTIAKRGNVVIDAKLGIRMLKGHYDFSVWLEADESVRAARYSQRDSITEEEAMKRLVEKQRLERESWKSMYGFDYFDQEKEADLVVDVGDKAPEEIMYFILGAMEKKGVNITGSWSNGMTRPSQSPFSLKRKGPRVQKKKKAQRTKTRKIKSKKTKAHKIKSKKTKAHKIKSKKTKSHKRKNRKA